MKKYYLAVISALLFSISNGVYAGNLYLGPSVFVQDNITSTSNYRGVHPRLAVGYAEMLENFYIAGEVFGVPGSATLEDNYSNGATSARSTRSIGISVLPGGLITESVLGFARIGVVNTEFSGPSTSRAGAQAGLGLETCLTKYWDLRVEYIYTMYKSVPALGSVKSDQMGLGLVYKVMS